MEDVAMRYLNGMDAALPGYFPILRSRGPYCKMPALFWRKTSLARVPTLIACNSLIN